MKKRGTPPTFARWSEQKMERAAKRRRSGVNRPGALVAPNERVTKVPAYRLESAASGAVHAVSKNMSLRA